MSNDIFKRKLQEAILKTSPEYLWLRRDFYCFIFSLIGVILAFMQYYGLIYFFVLPPSVMFIIKWWAGLGTLSMLILCIARYGFKEFLVRSQIIIDNKTNGVSMPEQQTFDKYIHPDNPNLQSINEQEELENKITKNSVFYGLIGLVALYIQVKTSVYQDFSFFLLQIWEFFEHILFIGLDR